MKDDFDCVTYIEILCHEEWSYLVEVQLIQCNQGSRYLAQEKSII